VPRQTAPAPVLDHPHIRQANRCPVCHNGKEAGLLVCWTCYRKLDLRNGIAPAIAQILANAERDAAALPHLIPLADVLSRRTRATLTAIEQRGGRQ
jgi:hypothetical protein